MSRTDVFGNVARDRRRPFWTPRRAMLGAVAFSAASWTLIVWIALQVTRHAP